MYICRKSPGGTWEYPKKYYFRIPVPLSLNMRRRVLLIVYALLLASRSLYAMGYGDTVRVSNAGQALAYLNSIKKLEKSKYWPNIDPNQFLTNLKTFTVEPLAFYEGKATNFCAYSTITYIPLRYDPLGFSRFMISLYRYGQASMGNTSFTPSKAVREEAGLIKYKGPLDINPAGQMWFLALADEFKGYINLLNWRFHKGDENTFWASTNYAKFNRMLKKLFPVKIKAKGSDLVKPRINDIGDYLKEELKNGIVYVYLNNEKLYKRTHTKSLISTPTHFVMLVETRKTAEGEVEFVYWDYGRKTLQQLSPALLKNIVYGVTTAKFKTAN